MTRVRPVLLRKEIPPSQDIRFCVLITHIVIKRCYDVLFTYVRLPCINVNQHVEGGNLYQLKCCYLFLINVSLMNVSIRLLQLKPPENILLGKYIYDYVILTSNCTIIQVCLIIQQLRNINDIRLVSVSYTHLDVYKRQSLLIKIIAGTFLRSIH